MRAHPQQLPLKLPEPTKVPAESSAEILQALGDLLRQGAKHLSRPRSASEAGALAGETGGEHE